MTRYITQKMLDLLSTMLVQVLVLALLIPNLALGEESVENPIRVDEEYVRVEVTQSDNDALYTVSIESKDGKGLDWVSYVIRIDPKEMADRDAFLSGTRSNRTVYYSEDTVVDMVYVPAKSYARYLDFVALGTDWLFSAVGFNPSNDTTVPFADGNSYVIRSYSGALGYQDDREEWKFVAENIDEGSERLSGAILANIVAIGFEIATPVLPFAESLNDPVLQKRLNKALTKISAKVLVEIGGKGSDLDFDDILRMAKEVSEIIIDESLAYGADMVGEQIRLQAQARVFSFIGNTVKGAIGAIDISKKLSSAGKAINRTYDWVYGATPLETAYIVNAAAHEEVTDELLEAAKRYVEANSIEGLDYTLQVERRVEDVAWLRASSEGLDTVDVMMLHDADGWQGDYIGTGGGIMFPCKYPTLFSEQERKNAAAICGSVGETRSAEPGPTVASAQASNDGFFAESKPTVRFFNQYRNAYASQFSSFGTKLYTTDGEEVETLFEQTIEDRFGKKIKAHVSIHEVPAGTYVVRWPAQTSKTRGLGRFEIWHRIEAGQETVTFPQNGNWYVPIVARETGYEYVGWGDDITVRLVDENGPIPRQPSGGIPGATLSGEDIEDKRTRLHNVNSADGIYSMEPITGSLESGTYTVTFQAEGYEEESVTFTLPDIATWSDEEIIAKAPLKQDLGTIKLKKL